MKKKLEDKYLSEKDKEKCIKEIIDYFSAERNEEIGIIAASEILDTFIQMLGPDIYNKAIEDAKLILKKQLEGMDFELDLLKQSK